MITNLFFVFLLNVQTVVVSDELSGWELIIEAHLDGVLPLRLLFFVFFSYTIFPF